MRLYLIKRRAVDQEMINISCHETLAWLYSPQRDTAGFHGRLCAIVLPHPTGSGCSRPVSLPCPVKERLEPTHDCQKWLMFGPLE